MTWRRYITIIILLLHLISAKPRQWAIRVQDPSTKEWIHDDSSRARELVESMGFVYHSSLLLGNTQGYHLIEEPVEWLSHDDGELETDQRKHA
jgi:hypothetical protein